MTTIATIEARMTSTRLPGKVLLPVLGKPLLEYMIERVRRVPELDDIVIATTVNDADQPIVELAERLGVNCFRGSEDDVLERVLLAAQAYDTDVIVELTGDCSMIDPAVTSKVINRFFATGADYAGNVPNPTYPYGMETRVFHRSVLERTAELTDDPADHEHVSIFIYEHPELFKVVHVESGLDPKWIGFRLTLDTPEDYALFKQVIETLYPTNPNFTLGDILDLLESRPELQTIAQHVKAKPVRGE